jgi:Bacterial antitoxin of type II TA system, VapB
MKTTLEIDDQLYREAKALASLTGRKMKDLVSEGLRLALQPVPQSTTKTGAVKKLTACFAEADKVMTSSPRGPIAREHLSNGRN